MSEIHENVDLVLGIKNVFKLEGVINLPECCLNVLNRSIPLFPKEKIILKPKEQKLIKVEAPFIDEISGLAIVKILDKLMQSTVKAASPQGQGHATVGTLSLSVQMSS